VTTSYGESFYLVVLQQEFFKRFMVMLIRKCYTKKSNSKILRQMKEIYGDIILIRYSGGILFQNSPVENNKGYFILK